MLLNGDIRITDNADELKSLMFTHRIIFIGEPEFCLVEMTNGIPASLFIPPYEIIMDEMDGNMESFIKKYTAYLFSRECSEYIALIIRALYDGTNILLYLSKDESEMWYSKTLCDFLKNQYGITISYLSMPAIFNENYSNIVCDFLYSFDLMSIDEFFINYPDNISISPVNIAKLVSQLNPYVLERTMESYIAYFNSFKQTMKQNNNRYLTNLIQLV
ncbi:MAG: hypothetical protein M0P49_04505 [Bacilli bacterium]|nr:hypothetical protein [Bacilli bacterium]